MKNALTLFAGVLLIISSCKDKSGTPPPTIAVTSISLSTTSRTLIEKETFKLEAVITPKDASDKSVEWTSSKTDVATVADGVVTAVKTGSTTITAKSKSNTSLKAVECLITVVAKEVNATAIKINPAPASVLVGKTLQLNIIKTPADASDNVEWTSSDKEKAPVSSTGLVEGKVAGTFTITATSIKNPAIKGECQLTVTTTAIAVTGLTLKPTIVTLSVTKTQSVDKTQQLEITIVPANATNQNVTYKSDKPDIASVDPKLGLITANAGGTAKITATTEDGGKTAECAVTVTVPVASITLGPNPAKAAINGTLTLTSVVAPENASNKTLTWSSSAPTIASVTDKGVVTGVSAGTATITATAADGSGVTGTLPITVQNNQAALLTITLGTEKFNVAVPAEGATTTVANAPRTISSILSAVPVTLTAAANAAFKKGETDFTSGGTVDFSSGPVTFKVTAEDGITNKTYTVAITAYDPANNPYGVYTAAHLNDVRNNKAGSYLMKNNITLPARNEAGKAATGINDYAEKGWLPIADNATFSGNTITEAFTGIFDGGNFSIDNLYIDRSSDFIGLFAIASGAAIRNLGVTGTATAVIGFKYVGALVGYIEQGSISNCYASANVSLVNNAYSAGETSYVGGIVGYSKGTSISNSYSSGNISVNISKSVLSVGGFGGVINGGSISNCFAIGNVTASSTASIYGGGLIGQFYPDAATNCYATGDVTATAPLSYLGGLGVVASSRTYTNCYRNSDAVITKSGNGEANVDFSTNGISPKTKEQMQDDAFTTLLGNTVWGRDNSKIKNDGLPYIKGVGVGK